MKLPIPARLRKPFDQFQVRITAGIVFSLLVHGFILSLQFGIPGLGLPGLELPWNERRAQTPEIRVRIANPAGSPATELKSLRQPLDGHSVPNPQPALQQPINNRLVTELPSARIKQSPLRSAQNSLRVAKALQSTPAISHAVRKKGTPPPADQSTPAPTHSQPEMIALTKESNDSFVVPPPDPDDRWRTASKTDTIPSPARPPPEEPNPSAIAMQTLKQLADQAKEPAPAVQKPTEQESFERPDEPQAKDTEPTKTPDVAMELAARRQGDEIEQQDANHKREEREAVARDLETRKLEEAHKRETDDAARLLAAQKLEVEKTSRRAEELAAKKLEDAKKKELADNEREEKESEIRRQAEEITRQQVTSLALQKQAEEARKQEEARAEQQATDLEEQQRTEKLARQKVAELERKKAEEQLATLQKAQELAARQEAETEAAAQRENARIASKTAAGISGSGAGRADGQSGTGKLSKGQNTGNLAGKALENLREIDLTRLEPTLAVEPKRPEDDSRRRSIFGTIDHDVGLAMYIQGWRTKIETTTGSLNYSQSSKNKAREDPVVTVAIRSDGSVEDIIINRSSGRADLDEAVRRIVRLNERYSVFPANLARKYHVIEIRRVWNFDERLTLLEEVH